MGGTSALLMGSGRDGDARAVSTSAGFVWGIEDLLKLAVAELTPK